MSISTELYSKAKGRSVTSGDFLKKKSNLRVIIHLGTKSHVSKPKAVGVISRILFFLIQSGTNVTQ